MRTYSQKPAEVTRQWHILDASGVSLGRISTVAASLLIGKDKPTFTPHVDGGDFVIVINAGEMKITGGKNENKIYWRHSGFPGGIKGRKLADTNPVDALAKAVRGMIPVNKLRPGRLERLKIYAGAEHNHAAQKPQVYDLKGNK